MRAHCKRFRVAKHERRLRGSLQAPSDDLMFVDRRHGQAPRAQLHAAHAHWPLTCCNSEWLAGITLGHVASRRCVCGRLQQAQPIPRAASLRTS